MDTRSILGPSWEPKSLQNRSEFDYKIGVKSKSFARQFPDRFLDEIWTILGLFLFAFRIKKGFKKELVYAIPSEAPSKPILNRFFISFDIDMSTSSVF